jgi:hypothetical protein
MSNKIPATVRNSVWINHIGNDKGTSVCFCCKSQPIDRGNYECGHVISRHDGGSSTVENLRPICGLCNKSMGTKNMEDFRKTYFKIEKIIDNQGSSDRKLNNMKLCETCKSYKSDTLFKGPTCNECLTLKEIEIHLAKSNQDLTETQAFKKKMEDQEKILLERIAQLDKDRENILFMRAFSPKERISVPDQSKTQNLIDFDDLVDLSQIEKDNDKKDELTSYLQKLTVVKLKQLCRYFEVEWRSSLNKANYIQALSVKSKQEIQDVIDIGSSFKLFIEIHCEKQPNGYGHMTFSNDERTIKKCPTCRSPVVSIDSENNAFYKE